MKLNPNSWFMRKYLGGGYRPRTVCELVWRTFTSTLMYAFMLAVASCVAVPALVSIGGLGVVGLTDMTFDDVFGKNNSVRSMMLFTFFCELTVFAFVASLFWLEVAYDASKRRMRKPSIARQVATGMYRRVKDKTCMMITYEETK